MTIPDNLTTKTLNDIIAYIRDNHMQAGDSLPTEQDFLEILNCSRTTLREVLSYLKGLGIVTSRRGSGFKIASVDVGDILQQVIPLAFSTGSDLVELLEMRRSLEIGIIEQAVLKANDEDIQTIKDCIHEYEEFIFSEGPVCYTKLGKLESSLHAAFYSPSKSSFVNIINTSVTEYFKSLLNSPPKEELTKEQLKPAHEQHLAILSCFKVKNPAAARCLLQQHLCDIRLEEYV